MPHSLGLIPGVTAYFVDEEHSALPANRSVIGAVQEILTSGTTSGLPTQIPAIAPATQELLHAERFASATADETRAHLLTGIVKLQKIAHPDKISASEAELRDLLFASISKPATD